VPVVKVDGKPVKPTTDTGGKDDREVVVPPPPPPPPGDPLVGHLRGGRVKLSRAGVAAIAAKVTGGDAAGTVTLTAKLKRKRVRIGSARVTLPAGRTVKARVKISRAARRAIGRRGLRATAVLSVGGAAPARAAVRLKR
jgi:hypothetical protein